MPGRLFLSFASIIFSCHNFVIKRFRAADKFANFPCKGKPAQLFFQLRLNTVYYRRLNVYKESKAGRSHGNCVEHNVASGYLSLGLVVNLHNLKSWERNHLYVWFVTCSCNSYDCCLCWQLHWKGSYSRSSVVFFFFFLSACKFLWKIGSLGEAVRN